MTIYWPRRSDGLPPGQRLMHDMPRFTDDPFRPPPDLPACAVTFSVDRQPSRWSPRPISKQWGSTTIVSTSTASRHGRSRISSGPVSRCATSPSPSGACSQKRQLVQRCEHGWLRGSRRGHPGSGGQASDQDNSRPGRHRQPRRTNPLEVHHTTGGGEPHNGSHRDHRHQP